MKNRAREEIAIRLHTQERTLIKVFNETSPINCSWEELSEPWRALYLLDANKILSLDCIQIKAEDQSLPEIPYIDELEYGDATCADFRWGARVAQKEMRDMADWMRVEKKGDPK